MEGAGRDRDGKASNMSAGDTKRDCRVVGDAGRDWGDDRKWRKECRIKY